MHSIRMKCEIRLTSQHAGEEEDAGRLLSALSLSGSRTLLCAILLSDLSRRSELNASWPKLQQTHVGLTSPISSSCLPHLGTLLPQGGSLPPSQNVTGGPNVPNKEA